MPHGLRSLLPGFGVALLLFGLLSAASGVGHGFHYRHEDKPLALGGPAQRVLRIDRLEPASQLPGKQILIHGQGFTGSRPMVMLLYHGEHPVVPRLRRIDIPATPITDQTIRLRIPLDLPPASYGVAIANAGFSNEVRLTVSPYRYKVEFREARCVGSDYHSFSAVGTVIADRHAMTLRTFPFSLRSPAHTFSDETIATEIEVADHLYLSVVMYGLTPDSTPSSYTRRYLDSGPGSGPAITYPAVESDANRRLLERKAGEILFTAMRPEAGVGMVGLYQLMSAASLQTGTDNAEHSQVVTPKRSDHGCTINLKISRIGG